MDKWRSMFTITMENQTAFHARKILEKYVHHNHGNSSKIRQHFMPEKSWKMEKYVHHNHGNSSKIGQNFMSEKSEESGKVCPL